LRLIPDDAKEELKKIFEVTGGNDLFNKIEEHSRVKAKDMGLKFEEKGINNEYFTEVFTANNKNHTV